MKKSSISVFDDQASFIWSLLQLYFVKRSLEDAIELASSIYEQDFEFADQLENLLLKLWKTSNVEILFQIAKYVVWQRLLDTENHIFIVAVLFGEGEITINDAALLLNINAEKKYLCLDERIRRVVDVAWLIIEDGEDGVMFPGDDDMLAEALEDVRSLYSEN